MPEAIKLARWYKKNRRRLPWREQPSLYRTVVSEFMLQQTRIETVLPYFDRWMKAFPDFKTLAQAKEAAVLKQWEGLGYYSRARNLQKLAKELTQMPEPPQCAADWKKLPGIGAYTAAAIASIAQGERVAVVDGNVVRVLSRLYADRTEFTAAAKAVTHFQPLADKLVDNAPKPGDHNQAMMELGATVCMRTNPACTICPLVQNCAAARLGEPERFPIIQRRKSVQRMVYRLFIHKEDGSILLAETASNEKRLAGIFELPLAETLLSKAAIAKAEVISENKRGISNELVTEKLISPKLTKTLLKKIEVTASLAFYNTEEIQQHTLSGPHRKWLKKILPLDGKTS